MSPRLTIYFHCQASELTRERQGYFEALSRVSEVLAPTNFLAEDTPSALAGVLLFPDPPITLIPPALPHAQYVTACFQIDAFVKPRWKALWSCLFDHVFVFHPGVSSHFSRMQHEGITLLPHAVRAVEYSVCAPSRIYDVGWVGTVEGAINTSRRRVLPQLSQRYAMNDWRRRYPATEVATIYLQSRIVVNIGRDDNPADANTRCFEAMAAGALLVTALPSELEELGFEQGVHFIGYSEENDLTGIIDHFLRNDEARASIAERARAVVLKEHTYDARAKQVVSVLQQTPVQRFAPARQWSHAKILFAYAHYYSKRLCLTHALACLKQLCLHSPWRAVWASIFVARCFWHLRVARCFGHKHDS